MRASWRRVRANGDDPASAYVRAVDRADRLREDFERAQGARADLLERRLADAEREIARLRGAILASGRRRRSRGRQPRPTAR